MHDKKSFVMRNHVIKQSIGTELIENLPKEKDSDLIYAKNVHIFMPETPIQLLQLKTDFAALAQINLDSHKIIK